MHCSLVKAEIYINKITLIRTDPYRNTMSAIWIGALLIPATILVIAFVKIYVETGIGKETTASEVKGLREEYSGELDSWCYAPNGDDCLWYTQCLAKRFTSQQSGSATYALGFAVPICTDFTESRETFSPLGQRWVDATRACLQKKLAPLLKQDPDLSDSSIRSVAFRTHVECYTDPNPGDPAVYSLPISDLARIVWITKVAFAKNFTESLALVYYILKGFIL